MSRDVESARIQDPRATKRVNPKSVTQEFEVPTDDGFFGLDELHTGFAKKLDELAARRTVFQEVTVLDFSKVEKWDVAALLWLVVALDYYKNQKTLHFLLRLPDGGTGGCDFLRRWHFHEALKNLANDPDSLLVEEQQGYFTNESGGTDHKVADESDELLRHLLYQDLAQIRNLADVRRPRDSRAISSWLTAECRNAFIESGIGFLLHEKSGVRKPEANLFAKEIVNEGILNVKQHPKASIGMVSLSVSEQQDALVLAIADNGEPIPNTIYSHYLWSQRQNSCPGAHDLPDSYPGSRLSDDRRADILNYATQPGTSRKFMELRAAETEPADLCGKPTTEIGMGLYYIRHDATDPKGLRGELLIATDGICGHFDSPPEEESLGTTYEHKWTRCGFSWPGNLLRVSIPIKPKN